MSYDNDSCYDVGKLRITENSSIFENKILFGILKIFLLL